jgi:hypothetical protein
MSLPLFKESYFSHPTEEIAYFRSFRNIFILFIVVYMNVSSNEQHEFIYPPSHKEGKKRLFYKGLTSRLFNKYIAYLSNIMSYILCCGV